ncbi:HD domain-containing protein [Longimicrobium sp.]|uniref:HD domain-containing protein n=1 Tax=Longimicrobium sp. TaxID=2029185 RepID=UPI003B3AFFF0
MTDVVDAAAVKSTFGRTVEERFTNRLMLNNPTRGNGTVERLIERINADDELYALWLSANVNAVERLGMTDHGPVHVKIVMNLATKLLRVLTDHGVTPGVVANYGMRPEDAEVVVIMASLLHDVGMSIHRKDHEEFSLFVAQMKLRDLLEGIYPRGQATIIRSEILHAIIGHRAGGKPMTIEAGVVRVADALDMAKGRSRIAMEAEGPMMSIHSISAAAIEAVHIETGVEKPVRIRVEMSNSAGIFQLDQLFREKLSGSGLEPYVEVEALIEGEAEKRLVQTAYRI